MLIIKDPFNVLLLGTSVCWVSLLTHYCLTEVRLPSMQLCLLNTSIVSV